MEAPLDPKNPTFYEKGEDGLIRLYDMNTGNVLQVLAPDAYASRALLEFVKIPDENGREVLVQSTINLDQKSLKKSVQFNQMIGDLICQDISNGKPLKEVTERMNLQYRTVCEWRRKYPEFNEALNLAYQDRADYLADRALSEAENSGTSPGAAAKAKLIVDTLWKSAEVANRKKYAPKVDIKGDVTVPIQVIIETGIRRPGDPGFIVDETAKLREVKEAPSVEPVVSIQGKAVDE